MLHRNKPKENKLHHVRHVFLLHTVPIIIVFIYKIEKRNFHAALCVFTREMTLYAFLTLHHAKHFHKKHFLVQPNCLLSLKFEWFQVLVATCNGKQEMFNRKKINIKKL